MTWQEAVTQSVKSKAIGYATDGRKVCRTEEYAVIEQYKDGPYRIAYDFEIEDIQEWFPAE